MSVILGKRAVIVLLVFAMLIQAAPAAFAGESGEYVNIRKCMKQINVYRKRAGVSRIKRDPKLEKKAKIRAKEIVRRFSHTRPNGKPGISLIKGNRWKGENIAYGQKSCREVMRSWYRSKGHRENMLRRQFKKVGIAGYRYKGRIYWVQLFSS